jgi:hypothetical protein
MLMERHVVCVPLLESLNIKTQPLSFFEELQIAIGSKCRHNCTSVRGYVSYVFYFLKGTYVF